MRRTLALASLGVAVAATLLPVASASAYCIQPGVGPDQCVNLCSTLDRAYQGLDARSGDALPDVSFYCLA